ncbi:hypothetical protein BGX38DRAFT_1333744 [Terfezia claveryi]|nr:hypothetical protein BGX38DRAFT_1333744 [Terfezia claveryi]
MAPPSRGVIFGPIKNWGKGSCKLLLEFCSEEGVKGRRQAVELLSRAIAIQDGVANGQLNGYEVDYQTALKEDVCTSARVEASLPTIFPTRHRLAPMAINEKPTRADSPATRKGNGTKGEPAKWVARLEEVNEEGDSDYKNIKKKGKRRKLEPLEAKPLKVLGQELGVDLMEPAIPWGLEDISANIFGITPPAWNLGESQGEWLRKKPRALKDWAEEMEKGLERASDSIPPTDLSVEEVEELVEELVEGHGQDKVKEDQKIEGEEGDSEGEDRRSSWKRIYEPRTEMEVVEAIRGNAEVLEELAELKKEERLWIVCATGRVQLGPGRQDPPRRASFGVSTTRRVGFPVLQLDSRLIGNDYWVPAPPPPAAPPPATAPTVAAASPPPPAPGPAPAAAAAATTAPGPPPAPGPAPAAAAAAAPPAPAAAAGPPPPAGLGTARRPLFAFWGIRRLTRGTCGNAPGTLPPANIFS